MLVTSFLALALAQVSFDPIRPLLTEQCIRCHNPDTSKGGLDLSRRETLIEGGTHGDSLNLLLKKVTDGKMPPNRPLDAGHVALLRRWIEAGAPWDGPPLVEKKSTIATPWSFAPLAKVEVPKTRFGGLAQNPIDRFLFQKLEAKGITPSPLADRRTLLRRVTFDLTGLPPTPEETDAFLADQTDGAYERVVRRLLANPAFGERWARHWLDVVRWGESQGYEQNHLRPTAWPYRDYVIHAINSDKPFHRFLMEQLAGDRLGSGDINSEVATGFLVAGVHDTVGNSTEEGRRQQRANDLEDIVSTTAAAFLGLTVGCARCHDHKFDPISQLDFYRMNAVFAGVKHGERVLGPKPAAIDKDRKLALIEQARRVRNVIHDLEFVMREKVLASQGVNPVPRDSVNTRRNVDRFAPIQARFVKFTILATKDNAEPCIDEIEIYGPHRRENLALSSLGAKATASSVLPGHVIHRIEHLNDGRGGNEWSWVSNERGGGWVRIELPEATVIDKVVWSRDGSHIPLYFDRLASRYRIEVSADGQLWKQVSNHEGRAAVPEEFSTEVFEKVLTAEEKRTRQLLYQEWGLVRGLLSATQPKQQTFYIGQFTTPDTIYLLKRGDVMQRGQSVEPGGLTSIQGGLDKDLIATEPGRRLALAEWLVGPAKHLTARVIVNRLWQHHFGRGIVATPSDFGNQGSKPSHPELLDFLAQDLIDHEWSLNRLHFAMVTSHAYQQAALANAKNEAIDADNVLLWRMPLRRLDAESLRDAILAVSGKLDRRMGGPSVNLFKYRVVNVGIYEPMTQFGPETWRRTIYTTAARAYREEMLASFDSPECAQRNPRRDATTTPLQALSLLNGPFTKQQATFFAERVGKDVELAFRIALGRNPGEDERRAAVALASQHGMAALCRALLNANEFLHY